jgi:hypothetical protein
LVWGWGGGGGGGFHSPPPPPATAPAPRRRAGLARRPGSVLVAVLPAACSALPTSAARLRAAVVVAKSGRRKTAGAMCHGARSELRRAAPQPAPPTAAAAPPRERGGGCSNAKETVFSFDLAIPRPYLRITDRRLVELMAYTALGDDPRTSSSSAPGKRNRRHGVPDAAAIAAAHCLPWGT